MKLALEKYLNFLIKLVMCIVLTSLFIRNSEGDELKESNYVELRKLIESNNIKRIEDLLPLLPFEYRSTPVLMFNSRSLHESSYVNPRAILFNAGAKLVLTFNGDPSQKNYNKLEIMEFDDKTKTFGFREISFPESGEGKVTFSEKNPVKCLKCHQDPPRPIFEPYPMWPGAYLGDGDTSPTDDSPEGKGLAAFLQSKNSNPRYRHLRYQGMGINNQHLIRALDRRNFENIVERLAESPRFPAFRYALLQAISDTCSLNDEMIVPDWVRKDFKKTLNAIKAETEKSNKEQYDRRLQVLRKTSNFSMYNKNSPYGFAPIDLTKNSNIPMFRYVSEQGLGLSVASWSMELEKGSYRFADPDKAGFAEMEPFLIKKLSENDPDLSSYFSGTEDFRTMEDKKAYCTYIQAQSHKAFEMNRALVIDTFKEDCKKSTVSVLGKNQEKLIQSSIGSATKLLEQSNATKHSIPLPKQLVTCMACHSGANSLGPPMPLDSPEEMTTLLKGKSKTSSRSLIKEINFRLSEKAGDGRMPLNLIISDSDRLELENYFKTISKMQNKKLNKNK